jgi:hypothetical protein
MKHETKNELITEGSELVALYDGWYKGDLPNNGKVIWLHPDKSTRLSDTLQLPTTSETFKKYSESWDWLMPVVHKIVKTEMPEKRGWSYEYLQLESTRIGNSIDYVYMKVVEFLKHKSRGGGN